MHIGIYKQSSSDKFLQEIKKMLDDANIRTSIVSKSALSSRSTKMLDCMIVLGGDKGTRNYFHNMEEPSIPVLGVSEGESGGFLTQIEYREFSACINTLKHQNYTIEELPRLCVKIDAKNTHVVLNDVAIFSSKSATLIEHTLKVNDDEVWHDSSDGIIISTPIGSSAYSMSAGGPVLFQDAKVFEIMSVNSLDVTRRPIIVSDNSTIKVEDISSKHHCEVILDGGFDRQKVHKEIECTQFAPPAQIVQLTRSSTAITALAKKVHLAEDLLRMPPSSKLILKTLEYEGELTHKNLTAKTLLPSRTIRLALSTLIKKGYVKKKVSVRDARQKIYMISNKIN